MTNYTKLLFIFVAAFIGNIVIAASYQIEKENLDLLLETKTPSVMDKQTFPPGVDPHNYISYASYWWPNPNTVDGYPYIRKDGVRNKELVKQGDAGKFHAMAKHVILLTQGFEKFNEPKYAEKAAEFLKVWFLNPETKMNPNMNNGQMIMGKNAGTKSGILEARYHISIIEVVPKLLKSKFWSQDNHNQLIAWYKEYYTWLISSKIGKDAAVKFKNNHGTWYDAQLMSIAIFINRIDFAKQIAENAKNRRIATQIEPDGKQPMELERTRSMTYSLFNLEALFVLSVLSNRVKIDLWSYETADRRSISKAYQYVLKYKDKMNEWPNKQIDDIEDWRWQVLSDRENILLNINR